MSYANLYRSNFIHPDNLEVVGPAVGQGLSQRHLHLFVQFTLILVFYEVSLSYIMPWDP